MLCIFTAYSNLDISLVFCRRAVYVISRCCCCLKLLEPSGDGSSVRRYTPTVYVLIFTYETVDLRNYAEVLSERALTEVFTESVENLHH
jgi:hypothetical protein